MAKIGYTYTVLSVNDRSMEVRYENPTYGSMHIGVRLPFEGESLEQVIEQYSPAFFWAEQSKPVQTITPGATGQGETVITLGPEDFTEEELLALWRDSAVISQLQAHYTLKSWGLYAQVEALVAALGDPYELAFNRAIEWRRNSETIKNLFSSLTLSDGTSVTEEVVDNFFKEAAQFTL